MCCLVDSPLWLSFINTHKHKHTVSAQRGEDIPVGQCSSVGLIYVSAAQGSAL